MTSYHEKNLNFLVNEPQANFNDKRLCMKWMPPMH